MTPSPEHGYKLLIFFSIGVYMFLVVSLSEHRDMESYEDAYSIHETEAEAQAAMAWQHSRKHPDVIFTIKEVD